MGISIATTMTTDLSANVAEQIRAALTKPKSVTQDEMTRVLMHLGGSLTSDCVPDYPMAIATTANGYTDLLEVIGWASATVWDSVVCLQSFVAEPYRGKGLATALASCLVVDNHLSQDMPVGVFSDESVRIAQRLKFSEIYRYRRTDDGWLRSERLFDEPRESRGVDAQ